MKPPIDGKLEFLRGMARRLLSLSERYERHVPESRPALGESMGLLGSLERVTRQSFEPRVPPPSPEPAVPVQRKLAPPAAPPTAPPAPRVATSRAEYRPALEQPSLVDALLRLQRSARHPSRRSGLIKARPPEPRHQERGDSPVGRVPEAAPAVSEPSFSAADFLVEDHPVVQAEPKGAASLRRPSVPTQTILTTPWEP